MIKVSARNNCVGLLPSSLIKEAQIPANSFLGVTNVTESSYTLFPSNDPDNQIIRVLENGTFIIPSTLQRQIGVAAGDQVKLTTGSQAITVTKVV